MSRASFADVIRARGDQELPQGVRLRIALDVLESLARRGSGPIAARGPSSVLVLDRVGIGDDGSATIDTGAGDRSGALVLVWEILAGHGAGGGPLDPLREVVDEIPTDVSELVAGEPPETIAALFEALQVAAADYVGTRDDVKTELAPVLAELARAARARAAAEAAARTAERPKPARASKRPPPPTPPPRRSPATSPDPDERIPTPKMARRAIKPAPASDAAEAVVVAIQPSVAPKIVPNEAKVVINAAALPPPRDPAAPPPGRKRWATTVKMEKPELSSGDPWAERRLPTPLPERRRAPGFALIMALVLGVAAAALVALRLLAD